MSITELILREDNPFGRALDEMDLQEQQVEYIRSKF
jgi:hypothetical protein